MGQKREETVATLEDLGYQFPRLLLEASPSTFYVCGANDGPDAVLIQVITALEGAETPRKPPKDGSRYLLPVHKTLALDQGVAFVTEGQGPWRRLGTVVRERGRFCDGDGRTMAWRLLDGVAELHRKGWVHGGLSLQCLFVDGRDNLWVGSTQGWRAWERATMEDFADDAWNVGCLLFVLWTGFRPFRRNVSPGEEEVQFPECLSDEKKRILSMLLEVNESGRATVEEIRMDKFFSAYRDETLIEQVSDGSDSPGSRSPSDQFDPPSARFDPPSARFDSPSSRFNPPSLRLDPVSARFDSHNNKYDSPSSQLDAFLPMSTGSISMKHRHVTVAPVEGIRAYAPNHIFSDLSALDYASDSHSWDGRTSRASDANEWRTVRFHSVASSSDPRELYNRICDPRDGFNVQDRRWRLKLYRSCFVGSEAVDWLIDKGFASDRVQAVRLGQDLLQSGAFRHVLGEHSFKDAYLFYTFKGTNPSEFRYVRRSIVLNGNFQWRSDKTARDPVELSESLLKELMNICAHYRFITLNDKDDTDSLRPIRSSWRRRQSGEREVTQFPFAPPQSIDYRTLRNSPEFSQFESATSELRATDLSKLRTRQAKIAFAVNMYNLLALHARILEGSPSSRLDRIRFFRRTCYSVGMIQLSLDDILHGILRGNRRGPLALTTARQFSGGNRSESRLKRNLIVKPPMLEALCAINSTSPYDPPIRPLNEKNVDLQIMETTSWFIKRWAQVSTKKLYDRGGRYFKAKTVSVVRLPRVFENYRGDFGGGRSEDELLQWAASRSGVADIMSCAAVSYWPWDFGQTVGSRSKAEAALCPLFWTDTEVKG